jgi:uncharacterized membrane protein
MAFVDNTIEVGADIREVYDMWTAFEDFPSFMEVVERVDLVPEDSLHWVAVVEDDVIEWDADVVDHVPDQSVAWKAADDRETGKSPAPAMGSRRATTSTTGTFSSMPRRCSRTPVPPARCT